MLYIVNALSGSMKLRVCFTVRKYQVYIISMSTIFSHDAYILFVEILLLITMNYSRNCLRLSWSQVCIANVSAKYQIISHFIAWLIGLFKRISCLFVSISNHLLINRQIFAFHRVSYRKFIERDKHAFISSKKYQ